MNTREDLEILETNVFVTKIYETNSMILGYEGRNKINMEGTLKQQVLKDKNITKSVLGIPYEYGNVIKSKIVVKPINGIVKTYQKGVDDIYSTEAGLKMSFDVVQQVEVYYSVGDIISDLGGIQATVSTVFGGLGTFFLINFIYQISKMARRKQQRKTRKVEIEFLISKMAKIEKIIIKKKDELYNQPEPKNEKEKEELKQAKTQIIYDLLFCKFSGFMKKSYLNGDKTLILLRKIYQNHINLNDRTVEEIAEDKKF